MTTTTPTNNIVRSVSQEDEFGDPNVNYEILMAELRDRIINLQYDLNNIRDPEVLGFASNLYLKLKNNYFKLMTDSMNLQHDLIIEQTLDHIQHKLGEVKNE